ncbi:MAG TPA: heparinase II/III family protein [Armatimonadota bacterium]|nr:heparinase II/III family protein [Armatimonadota bacterium]
MAGKLARGIGIARHMGIGWCAYRGVYELARRSGWLRLRSPARPWEAFSLDRVLSDPSLAEPESLLDRRRQGSRFLFDSARLTGAKGRFEAWDAGEETPQSIQLAESVLAGRIRFFEHSVHALGFPPDWHRDPYTGARVSAEAHWSQVPLLGASDIKAVWEANRFGWAYALARAYARTHDDRYAEAFWVALEDWCDRNSPGLGPHYACGQEVSLRVMAWAFALHAFMDSPATTADRVARMLQALGASGQRIEANIGYALSQRNNHGLSEGAGLFTLGAVFPEFRAARRWLTRGHRVIERLSRELIDEDGAFSQHSANYHRVALQVLSWTVALGDRAGHPLSDVARERLGRLASLLRAIQDETSGRVPCFGQNDGALVLPLSNCGYEDFRPALAGAWHVATGGRLYEDGPWDEECWWLGGATEPGAGCDGPTARAVGDTSALVSGYFAIRSNEGMAFTRCGRFRHRPAQADVLHVDIWWRGTNVACDAGTYSYNQPPPWDGGLGGTSYHNAVTVDGCDQMERAERFLWLPWVRGSCSGVRRSPCGLLACLEGSHDGYSRLHPAVSYRRAVILLPVRAGWSSTA